MPHYKQHAHVLDTRPQYSRATENSTGSSTWALDQQLFTHPNRFGKNGKSWWRSMSSVVTIYYARLKSTVSEDWNIWKSRPQPMSPKHSINSSQTSSTARFVFLCMLWYSTSALSSNTGKAILTQFRYPITLTFIQFGFVAFYCLLLMSPIFRLSKFRPPTKAIIRNTLPMGMFQVFGHMFSSMAISRIPVSTVHTIKALSPLFTVAAYALLFGVSYSSKTYISLLPLTLGVMLACSFDVSASNAVGLLCSFGSALIFVSSNIFFKKIMPSTGKGSLTQSSTKLDKINLLLYSASMAFILMIPLWIYYDVPALYLAAANPNHIAHPKGGHETPHSVTYYFIMNGTVNFAQNIIAFVILSSTSPVTYSIASLIKRVAVICIAIVWFNQRVHPIQALGIAMTFTGLYMYNNAKSDVERGEKKMRRVEAARDLMLPTTQTDSRLMAGSDYPPEFIQAETTSTDLASAKTRPRSATSATTYAFHHHPQAPTYIQPSHNLSIQTTSPLAYTNPSTTKDIHKSSPVDSYPSPPPSIDSPPSDTIPLPDSDAAWVRETYAPTIVVS